MQGKNIDVLLRCISEALIQQFVTFDVVIPYIHSELVAQFHQFGTIELEEYEEDGTHLRGHVSSNHSGPFYAFQRTPEVQDAQGAQKSSTNLISEHNA